MMEKQSVSEDIVARARHGDADAFEAIVRCYDANIRVMTHRILGAAWTEDVLQEAYIRAFRAFPNFVPERGSLAAWLHQIAYRACLDELGRSRRRGFLSDAGVDAAESGAQPSDDVVRKLSLLTALGLLTADERAAVVLVDALGFDYEEAARILDIPRGTIASRLSRARALIREALTDDKEDSEDEHVRAKG